MLVFVILQLIHLERLVHYPRQGATALLDSEVSLMVEVFSNSLFFFFFNF